MTKNKALGLYLAGAFGQMLTVCIAVMILRSCGVTMDSTTPAGFAAIAVGGISTALWGAVLTVKYRGYTVGRIIKDFFDIRQPVRAYLMMAAFLLADFFYLLFGGGLEFAAWYSPLIMFAAALVFGGIEEIGWRYFFQPVLEEKHGYIVSALITFCMWGTWHMMYFYVDGSLAQISVLSFLFGLLTNSFMLSALYKRTNSLWICVCTHALINVGAQSARGGSEIISKICMVLIIIAAVLLSRKKGES